jgi:hypothetical protein
MSVHMIVPGTGVIGLGSIVVWVALHEVSTEAHGHSDGW